MNELTSVVIPTYNRAATIERAIDSVLRQSYDNIEVIIVDDCSTDDTAAIVERYSDDRVHLYRLDKNAGACIARNKGIERARGRYIAFQDSDDEWFSNKLEVQIEQMVRDGAALSFCNFVKVDQSTSASLAFPVGLQEGIIDYSTLLTKSYVSTQCIVAETKCFEHIRFDPTMPRLQDWDIILALAQQFQICHVDQSLVNVYVQKESISAHPEKGIVALQKLWEKHAAAISANKETKRAWYIYLGNYKLANGDNPVSEYRNALKIRMSRDLQLKYILARLGLISTVYKKTGRL